MEQLSELEESLIRKLSEKYPLINTHLPFLRIKKREITGVGMYVYFDYSQSFKTTCLVPLPDGCFSTNETINFDSLEHGLNYEVEISNGKINYLELVSNGEDWDGLVPANFTIS